ncbi:hypothetical protein HDV00_008951 [Rhizophlyctis rosea]|nr:hypothetical protein HDV00_008951 [Rhizophlyctis rosea]
MPKTKKVPKFKLEPVKFKPAVKRDYDMIPIGLPRPTSGGFAMTLLGKRKAGKTNLICSMILKGYSRAFDSIIIVSPTVFLDRTYTSLQSIKGARQAKIWCTDQVTNETLQGIPEKQKQAYLTDPEHSATLVILDDSGNFLKAKEARKYVDIFYSTCRQYNCSIICSVQSVTMLTSLQLSNTQYWCIWALDGRATKKISNELSYHLTPKQFDAALKEATNQNYHFLYINGEADQDSDTFKMNFTEPLRSVERSMEKLNKVLEHLSTNPEWVAVDSGVKQKVINSYHEDLAEELLHNAQKEVGKPKRTRGRKREEQTQTGGDDGADSQTA